MKNVEQFMAAPWTDWGVRPLRMDGSMYSRGEDGKCKVFRLGKNALRLAAVEIEVENPKLPVGAVDRMLDKIPNCVWVRAPEGSLRNDGFEVVFKKPLPYDKALSALSQAYPLLDGAKSTFRAAVHVHFNVQDLSRWEYMRVCIAYALMEQAVFSSVGNGRDESIFCVPWSRSTSGIMNLVRSFNEVSPSDWASSIKSFSKYSGLNLQATKKYGSIEFRHMQTPAGDQVVAVSQVSDFMATCYWIIQTALAYDGSRDLMKFAQYMLDCMDGEGYTQPTPSHMAYVYALLNVGAPIDVLDKGLSVKAGRDVVNKACGTRRRRLAPAWRRPTPTASGIPPRIRRVPSVLVGATPAQREAPDVWIRHLDEMAAEMMAFDEEPVDFLDDIDIGGEE